eukprot:14786397-Ditylum_brightwellii.AAC.1
MGKEEDAAKGGRCTPARFPQHRLSHLCLNWNARHRPPPVSALGGKQPAAFAMSMMGQMAKES